MVRYEDQLNDTFHSSKVRVLAEDGVEYTGWLKAMHEGNRHYLLYDAERDDGTSVGAVAVHYADKIELVEPTLQVERLSLDELHPSPYSTREFAPEDNQNYIRHVMEQQKRKAFPLVRPVENGYEVIDGHKGVWVCGLAGVESQPCRIVEMDDWEATKRFVYEHFATAEDYEGDGELPSGWYDSQALEESLTLLYEEWGDRIRDLYPVSYNLGRLNLRLDDLE